MNLHADKPINSSASEQTALGACSNTPCLGKYPSAQVFIPRSQQSFNPSTFLTSREVIKNMPLPIILTEEARIFSSMLHRTIPDKPLFAILTSTLKSTEINNVKTTAWIEWCKQNDSAEYLGREAVLFDISEEVNIFTIKSKADHKKLLDKYPHPQNNNLINWELLAEDYDACHCTGDYFPLGWDCESTVWFNREKMKFNKIIDSKEIALR